MSRKILRPLAVAIALFGLVAGLSLPGCNNAGSAEAAKEKYAQGAKDPAESEERGANTATSGNQK